jgi:hypothetical protein
VDCEQGPKLVEGLLLVVTGLGLDLGEQVSDPGVLFEQDPYDVAFGQLGGLAPVLCGVSHAALLSV